MLLASCYGREAANFQASPATPYAHAIEQGQKFRKSGQFSQAITFFAEASSHAKQLGHASEQGKALLYQASCEVLMFRYRSAIGTLNQADELARQVKDDTLSGQIAINKATLYYQLGDFAAAELAAQRSVEKLLTSPRQDHFALALDNLAGIEFGRSKLTAGKDHFRQALALTQKNDQPAIEAKIADNFGIWLVLEGELNQAEPFLQRSFEIRKKQGNNSDLLVSHEHLAELEQKKGKNFLSSALQHINTAMAQHANLGAAPEYYPFYVRGTIYRDLNKPEAALADFQVAAASADVWRQSALPGDATNTRTSAQLTAVYQDYAQCAASLSLKTHNQGLSRLAFSVLAAHRATSLGEQLTRANRSKLVSSPEYFSLLQQLQVAQADVSLSNTKAKTDDARKNLDQIRAQLNDLENRLGLDKENVVALSGNNRKRNLLRDIQSRLGPNAALLSFTLGSAQSYLWTVTSKELTLHQLPGRKTVEEQVRQFRAAVHEPAKRSGLPSASQALFRTLFSQIPSAVSKTPEWLIAPDGELLNAMPFAALPAGLDGASAQPLSSVHSLRILPGAMLPGNSPASAAKSQAFLGVGDPIYNRADKRFDRTSAAPSSAKSSPSNTLARLVASEKELKASAQACALPHTYLLTGRDASGSRLRQSTATIDPGIVHFAVHVISPEGRPGEAALALSLTRDGFPEFLTAEVVSTLRTPGALVVLSGCASQQGDIVPGSGLVGLSRSWLLAGAEAVVVSAWPTPDDSGEFFSTFYKHYRLAQGVVSRRAASALQQTQLEMARTGSYRGDVGFWAAYSIVSKE